jgi:hypothetical protein
VIRLEFRTVSDELLGVASAAASWLKDRGYTVTPERQEVGYPYTPTLHGKRASATAFIEVDVRVDIDRMKQWVAYGRSCKSDTRVWCVVAEKAKRSGKQDRELKGLGVGLLLVGEGAADEMMAAKDLALGVELPDLTTLPSRVRKRLGPVYEHFDRAEWREGFAEACLALEVAARNHLWKGVKTGRIVVPNKSGEPEQLRKQKIDKLSMGQLSGYFGRILQQSHSDRLIGDALKQINPNRVRLTHHKNKAAVEARLRRDVGGQMWLIVGALKEIDGSP